MLLNDRGLRYDRELVAAKLRDEMALPVAVIAAYLGVSPRTASNYIHAGRYTISEHRKLYGQYASL